jgi:glycerol-3-phosphate dehydrogenase
MLSNDYEIMIIGGGILGVGIAAEAATRGLSVCLAEKKDFGWATSSSSSKLIHGGLRYLENWDFHLVREALHEQTILLERAPHLVKALPFYLPHEAHHRAKWLIRSGLYLYDHLKKRPLPKSRFLHFTEKDPEENPLSNTYQSGFCYYDCQTDDSRLVLINALLAKQHGGKLINYCECLHFERKKDRWHIQLKKQTGELMTVTAQCLVHAAGPWTSDLQPNLAVRLIKGSHIVVPKQYNQPYAFLLQHPDNRVFFVTPYHKHWTMIGTTEIPFHGSPDQVKISSEEINYLIAGYNHYFKRSIAEPDITHHWSGVRTMQFEKDKSASQNTREHVLKLETDQQNQLPCLSIYGGKLTTYRAISEHCVDQLYPFFPQLRISQTKSLLLPGGEPFEISAYTWLPETLLSRYTENYGSLIHTLLSDCTQLSDLGKEVLPNLYEKEIEYLKNHEWAVYTEDILWRRTKLGLTLPTSTGNA